MAIDQERPYSGLRVIELASDVAGEMTGKLLAQMGADVHKVEPPTGSPTRRIGPFAQNAAGDPNSSLTFWYYNTSKRSITLDLSTKPDRDRLTAMVADADVLLLSSAEWAMEPADWSHRFPSLIVLVISPFGLDGPWAAYRGSDLVQLAVGGALHLCGYDDHSVPPIRPGDNQSFHMAASSAHVSLLLALLERERSGDGQVIDVSIHASVALNLELALPFWFYNRVLVHRQTNRHAQPSPTQPATFESSDGRFLYFALMLGDAKPWASLVQWMESEGLAADLIDPAYDSLDHRQANFPHIQSMIEVFFLLHDGQTLYEEGQARGLPIGLLLTPSEILDDPHLLQRSFFERTDGAPGVYPGAPYRFSSFGARPQWAAPRIGQHNEEVKSWS